MHLDVVILSAPGYIPT